MTSSSGLIPVLPGTKYVSSICAGEMWIISQCYHLQAVCHGNVFNLWTHVSSFVKGNCFKLAFSVSLIKYSKTGWLKATTVSLFMAIGIKLIRAILLVLEELIHPSGVSCQLFGIGRLSGRTARGNWAMNVSSSRRLAWAGSHESSAFQEEQKDKSWCMSTLQVSACSQPVGVPLVKTVPWPSLESMWEGHHQTAGM